MKKFLGFTAVFLVLALSLCACSINLSSEAEPAVREMLSALAAEDLDAAVELLHPASRQETDRAGMEELAEFLNGRAVTAYSPEEFNIVNRVGTSDKTETGTAKVTLDDNTTIYVKYVYETTTDGKGFTTFRISVGT